MNNTIRAEEMSKYWSYDRGTREWCFDGNHVHGYYVDANHVHGCYDNLDSKVELSIFSVKDGKVMGYSEEVTLNKAIADAIIEDIESNPDDYFIRVYDFQNGRGELHILYHLLDNMPFDKNGVHATGVEYLETNGDWVIEYEDDEDYDFIVKEVKF